MTLGNLPAYRGLAATAAARLGSGSADVQRAILAQWSCEQPAGIWPPVRNNPGNNALGWAASLSYPYTVQSPNPQPGNPIVTYRSPSDGALAYADGLRLFGRYAAARAAIHAGDGPAFLRAVTAAGYGTRLSCALGAYNALGGNADLASSDTTGAQNAARFLELLRRLGISTDRSHLVTVPEAQAIGAAIEADPSISLRGIISGKTVGQLLDSITAGKYSPPSGPIGDVNAALAGVGDAIAGIPGAIGNVAIHVVLFVGILALVAFGLYTLARSES